MMIHDEDGELLEATNRVLGACATMSMDDRLLVLQLAWVLLAQQARNEALAFPGGFPTEQAHQLEQLEKIALLVREDTPDLELERPPHARKATFEGARQHLRKLNDDLQKGGA